MNVCGTKPPPRLSSAKSAESRSTIGRERWSGFRRARLGSRAGSTAGESPLVAISPAAAATGYASSQCGDEPASAISAPADPARVATAL